jgi:hypothetical protein
MSDLSRPHLTDCSPLQPGSRGGRLHGVYMEQRALPGVFEVPVFWWAVKHSNLGPAD